MALKHRVYDTDTHFLINPTTRAFYNESPSKNTIIQYDHNSERITFEIPRQIEGHDISLCDVIQVHYINIDAVTKEQNCGVYAVEDMQISPDDENIVILSWLVSGNATKYVGSLNFLIRFACSAEDGTLYYVWNTAIYSGISVSSGIYNGAVVAEEYADILAQWEKELMDAGGEGVNKVEEAQNNALAEIETAKQAAIEELNNRNTALFANALKGYKSGSVLALTDVSPLEHVLRVKARSETDNTNMVNISAEPVMTGEYDGIALVGEVIFQDKALFMQTIGHKCGEYEISCTYDTYSLIGNGVKLSLNIEDGYPGYVWGVSIVTDSSWDMFQKAYSTITVSKKDIFVNKFGKNLIPFPYAETTITRSGVTFTVNDDRSVTMKGAASADSYFILQREASYGDTYINAVAKPSGSNGIYAVSEDLFYNFNNKTLSITIPNGTTVDKTIYPQIEYGTTATEYEPYKEPITYPIAEDGTVEGVTSNYPTTTLTTDTEGIVLDVEYNRDINKAFAELQNAMISLGGNI